MSDWIELVRQAGSTSQSVEVALLSTTTTPVGMPATGLNSGSAGLAVAYRRGPTGALSTYAPGAIATAQTGYTANGMVEVQPTNMPGVYRFDLPNAAFAAGVSEVYFVIQATGVFPVYIRVTLSDYDPVASGPTTSQFAQAVLKEDMALITGEASRSMLNTFRTLRNRWSISGSTLTVYKEDDTTVAFTAQLTSVAGADGITGMDPQ